jgi:hypothetical protein
VSWCLVWSVVSRHCARSAGCWAALQAAAACRLQCGQAVGRGVPGALLRTPSQVFVAAS